MTELEKLNEALKTPLREDSDPTAALTAAIRERTKAVEAETVALRAQTAAIKAETAATLERADIYARDSARIQAEIDALHKEPFSMEFIKSWKFAVIVVIVLSVLAVAGVIYGVSTHTEPGLMSVTPGWTANDFPLTVCPSSYVEPQGSAVHSVRDAVETTNTRLGFEAFKIDCQHSAVSVAVGVPSERGWTDPGGNTVIRPRSCTVQTSNTGTEEILNLVLQHELGHCLGLAHDDFQQSIMRHAQSATPAGTFPPNITDFDKSLLVRLYGPRHAAQ